MNQLSTNIGVGNIYAMLQTMEACRAEGELLLSLLPQRTLDAATSEPLYQRIDQPDKKPETLRSWLKDALCSITSFDESAIKSPRASKAQTDSMDAAEQLLAMRLYPIDRDASASRTVWELIEERTALQANASPPMGVPEQTSIQGLQNALTIICHWQPISKAMLVSQSAHKPQRTSIIESANALYVLMTALADKLPSKASAPSQPLYDLPTHRKNATNDPCCLADWVKDIAANRIEAVGRFAALPLPANRFTVALQSLEDVLSMKLINTQNGKKVNLWDAVAEQLANASGEVLLPQDKKLISDIKTHLFSLCDNVGALIETDKKNPVGKPR